MMFREKHLEGFLLFRAFPVHEFTPADSTNQPSPEIKEFVFFLSLFLDQCSLANASTVHHLRCSGHYRPSRDDRRHTAGVCGRFYTKAMPLRLRD